MVEHRREEPGAAAARRSVGRQARQGQEAARDAPHPGEEAEGFDGDASALPPLILPEHVKPESDLCFINVFAVNRVPHVPRASGSPRRRESKTDE